MKNILVTGGDHGIGRAIVHKLSPAHFTIIRGNEIHKASQSGTLKKFIDAFLEGITLPDIVINNYGINHLSWIGETKGKDSNILDINVLGPYWIINKLRERQLKEKPNHKFRVVNVTSQTYRIPQRTTSLYCASKAALNHMTKVMARELAPHGWVINNFAPGKVLGTKMTEMTDAQVNSMRGWTQKNADQYAKKLIPNGTFMSLEEASTIVKTILEMPSYVNGSTIEAFGGA